MDLRRLKFVGIGAGVFLSLAFLIWVGVQSSGGMTYYLTVSEFLEQGVENSDFRVNGKVVEGSIERFPSGHDVRFDMVDPAGGGETLTVSYHGIIPDTFVDRADVVVEGAMGDGGEFEAHTLLAKCPSKYEAADGYAEPASYE